MGVFLVQDVKYLLPLRTPRIAPPHFNLLLGDLMVLLGTHVDVPAERGVLILGPVEDAKKPTESRVGPATRKGHGLFEILFPELKGVHAVEFVLVGEPDRTHGVLGAIAHVVQETTFVKPLVETFHATI